MRLGKFIPGGPRTSACFRVKARLMSNEGQLLGETQTGMIKMRLSCWKTRKILNVLRFLWDYRLEKSLFP